MSQSVNFLCNSNIAFPKSLTDLDKIKQKIFTAGLDLHSNHPGFNDQVYLKRRAEIAYLSKNSSTFKVHKINYSPQETEIWQKVFDVLTPLHTKYACTEYLKAFSEMIDKCGYSRNTIPQLQDINNYLTDKTGFRLVPTSGMLSERDAMSYLAFRCFACTQYIRHHSNPFYTPEPDVIHELIGHAPMFLNEDFADFSQKIGKASLGASDEVIRKLASCYWFSMEFGLFKETESDIKIMGAGILSSVDEIKNVFEGKSEMEYFKPKEVCNKELFITNLQKVYYWNRNFQELRETMESFIDSLAEDKK